MMPPIFSALLTYLASRFFPEKSLHLKLLALEHQLAVYKRSVRRPRLHPSDRLFLGMAISALVWLAGSAGLRPASYSHRLAKKAISGPLEPVEQERQGRPSAHFQGSA